MELAGMQTETVFPLRSSDHRNSAAGPLGPQPRAVYLSPMALGMSARPDTNLGGFYVGPKATREGRVRRTRESDDLFHRRPLLCRPRRHAAPNSYVENCPHHGRDDTPQERSTVQWSGDGCSAPGVDCGSRLRRASPNDGHRRPVVVDDQLVAGPSAPGALSRPVLYTERPSAESPVQAVGTGAVVGAAAAAVADADLYGGFLSDRAHAERRGTVRAVCIFGSVAVDLFFNIALHVHQQPGQPGQSRDEGLLPEGNSAAHVC